MPNTYTQIYLHFVFAVKYREAVIKPEWEDRLHRYITGIVQGNGHKLLAVNSAFDHNHLFIGFDTKQTIADLMRLIKGDSAEFVNNEKFTPRKFHWQDGYGAFSHGRAQLDDVIGSIQKQKEHHQKKSFREEYLALLKKYDIAYDEKIHISRAYLRRVVLSGHYIICYVFLQMSSPDGA